MGNEIFYLNEQPKRMVVVGGGFIALEFASILDGLGTDVTLMYRGDLFLRGFDQDMREHLREEMTTNSDIDVQFNTDPQEIIKNDDGSLNVVRSCMLRDERARLINSTWKVPVLKLKDRSF